MAPTSLMSLANQTLDNTVGAAFLGVVGASLLFGITTVQAYWYYHSYPNDSLLHKCSVSVLWVLDALHLALTVHTVYTYVVTGFGDTSGLINITWSIKLQVAVNVVIILMVHSLYTLRVWLLGGYHRGFLGYLVASVVTGGFVIGVVLAYSIYTVHTYPELQKKAWVINAALGTSTAIDFVISAAMCFYLRKSKGRVSSACSLSAMFSYILLPNTFIFLAIEFLLTKLYVGSFLAMLNARERKRPGIASEEESSIEDSWQRHLKLHNTSSFWSPVPQSMTTIETPQSPGTMTKSAEPTYPWQ